MSYDVSIIIPTYNRRLLLGRALESVYAQTFDNWNIFVVDDGSTDETLMWIENEVLPKDHRVNLIRSPHRGVSHARNLGIKASRSEWVAFLDSDDEYLPHRLARQLELAAAGSFKFVHGEEIWIRNGRRVNPMKKHAKSGGRIFENSVHLCCISPSASLIHRNVLKDVGLFREDFPACEDYEYWLRLTSKYEVGFVEEPIIKKYGGHKDQLSQKYKAMDYWRVKALAPYLNCSSITHEERLTVSEVLRQKCQILLKGYQKHQNWVHFEEISQIYASVDQEC